MAGSREKLKTALGRPLTVSGAVCCHIGHRRTNNEDNFYFSGLFLPLKTMDQGGRARAVFSDGPRLFAVCDGMGGEQGGERASYLAVSSLRRAERALTPGCGEEEMEALIRRISLSIARDAEKNGGAVEGCTAAMLLFTPRAAVCLNVGDSRVYRLRNGKLDQISRDHSPVYEMVLSGALTREEARVHPRANVISRYLGMTEEEMPSPLGAYRRLRLRAGDTYLMCSDGLSDLMPDQDLEKILQEEENAAPAADRLLQAALERGGKDNVTVMVLKLLSPSPAR